jgi:hypothetical protein
VGSAELGQPRRLQIRILCDNGINDIQDGTHRVTYHLLVAAKLFRCAHRLDLGQNGVLLGAMSDDGFQHGSRSFSLVRQENPHERQYVNKPVNRARRPIPPSFMYSNQETHAFMHSNQETRAYGIVVERKADVAALIRTSRLSRRRLAFELPAHSENAYSAAGLGAFSVRRSTWRQAL